MKKLLSSCVIVLVSAFVLVGCSQQTEEPVTPPEVTDTNNVPPTP